MRDGKEARLIQLGEITEINPKGPAKSDLLPDMEVDFLPMAQLHENGSMYVREQRQYHEVAKGYTAFKSGDVLLAKITPCFENNKIALANVSTPWAFGSTEFHVLRPHGCLDPRYLTHFLRQDSIRVEGERRMTGSGGQRRVPKAFLENLSIPLPPLDEQRRIAGILDQADALRRLRARALDKLNTLGQAIFHEMFGDGGSYNRYTLETLIEARSSLADPTAEENLPLPHVGPEHIQQGSGVITWKRVRSCAEDGVTSGKYRFEAGDVIYSKIRPYLNKVAIADRAGMCSADMYALTPKTNEITVPYLHFVLGSQDFLSYAATVSGRANIPKMNRKQLMAYTIAVPPRQEQEQFEKQLNLLWRQNGIATLNSDILETLFTSLQHRAFRGEL